MGADGDDLLVERTGVIHLQNADRIGFGQGERHDRLGANHEHVERIPIFRKGVRDEAIVLRIMGRGIKDPVQNQSPGLLVEFVLVFASGADFDASDEAFGSDALLLNGMPNVHKRYFDLQLMYATILAREVEKKERIRERRELRYHKSVKRRIAFFVFLPFLLVSCGKDNSLKCPLENNGDISALSSPTEYKDVCAKTSAERLIERMDNGESVSFLFTSTSCNHCAEWKSTFVSFLQDNPYEVNLFENGLITYTEYRTVLNLFKELFQRDGGRLGRHPDALRRLKKAQLHYLGAANL
jgi:hypothetical protein